MESTSGNNRETNRSNSDRDMRRHNADQPFAGSGVVKNSQPTEQAEKMEQSHKERQNSDKQQSIFVIDIDEKQGLDMKKFREVMKTNMGNMNDEDLDILFMKIDTNCDGTVTWERFKNYMQLEHEAKDSMNSTVRPLYFPKPIKVLRKAHCKAIVALQFYPFQKPQGEKMEAGGFEECAPKARIQQGFHLSISQDGNLSYWSERFELLHSVNLDNLKHMHAKVYQKIWVTDMICLRNIELLAISSTSHHLEFYDISARECDLAFTLTGLDCSVTAMDYWSDGKKGIFTYGDVNGCVTVFTSADVIHNGLFNRGTSKTGGDCHISVADLQKNSCGNFSFFKEAIHKNCCQQIRFLPKLNVIATSSASDQTAMVLTKFPDSCKSEVHNTVFHLRKGIMCFDYSPDLNILVTGGLDRIVRVWRPCVTKRAYQQMEGHFSVITYILVNGRDKKVISISKDKNLRVWDLQDCSCLQNIRPNQVSMGRPPITSTFYNRDTNTLVVATSLVGVLQGAIEDPNMLYKAKTHNEPLCAALYNTNFKQVVSGCHDGVVCVWDLVTGEKVMQFQTSPKKPVEVTAMSFDGPQRRLITGSYDGMVRIWNFNNGALLLQLPRQDRTEVTGIVHINKRFYVSGWSKYITCYKDVKKNSQIEHYVWNRYHSEDVYSMHAYGSDMLVTASYNGDIIIWSTSSRDAICRFNASESSQRQMPICQESVRTKMDKEEGQSKVSNSITPEDVPKPRMAVEKALFLITRNHSPDTAALLTSTAHGYVYAWSVCKQGGLLGKFRATRGENTPVSTMATDSQNQMLLTGDSKGIITVWDIQSYCYCMLGKRDEKEEEAAKEKTLSQSTFVPKNTQVRGELRISLSPPTLLSSWRCHQKRIVHLEYVEKFQVIVTASLDCNVRLWTFTGTYIGTFGQVQWCVNNPDTFAKELPTDLRRLGGTQTADDLDEPDENYEDGDQETPAPDAPDSAAAGELLEPMEATPLESGMDQCSDEQIEDTWIQWQKDGKKSRILGQAYKPKVKNLKPPCRPDLSAAISSNEPLRVSKFLSCTPLVPVTVPPVPEILKKKQKSKECTDTVGKQKSRKKCTTGKQHHKDNIHTSH